MTRAARVALLGPAAAAGAPELVESKLVTPRQRREALPRKRLLRQFVASRDVPLVLLKAPPGYGKSVALAHWAGTERRSVAWLTADDGDNDPVRLVTYLAAALDRLEPLQPLTFDTIASRTLSPRAAIAQLLSVIAARPTPVLIVIDDAHRITEQASLDAIGELVQNVPAGSQVAMASRGSIGLPLARWRSQGSVLEIGPSELAMDVHETAQLMRQMGVSLSAEAIEEVHRRTEGWPALLALAASAGDLGTGGLPGSSRARPAIADYLRAEVLEGRSEAEITFLTCTSILEMLTGPACDAVTGAPGSKRRLAELSRSTLLIDEYGGGYRYHTLLRELLIEELEAREPEQVGELHHRAAEWHAASGDIEAAIRHAFAAGKMGYAASLVGRAVVRFHWSGRRATVREWMRQFDDDLLRTLPWLAVLAAWEELSVGAVAAAEHFADLADSGSFQDTPPDGTASFESGRAILRAVMSRRGTDAMLADASLAVELEVPGRPWRDMALWMRAIAELAIGEPARADATLAEAVAAARALPNPELTYCLLGHRAQLAVDRGDWAAAVALANEGLAIGIAERLDGYMASSFARSAEARIMIHEGDARRAQQALARAALLRTVWTAAAPASSVLAIIAFARAHLAIGDVPGARALLTQASSVIRERPDLGVLPAEVAALRELTASAPIGLGGASTLTPAELRVLSMLPYYLSFKEIAQRLDVKATTVKTHALSIYGKLGASTRSEAVECAVDAGLLEAIVVRRPSVSAIGEDVTRA